jgi:hypothetical protein
MPFRLKTGRGREVVFGTLRLESLDRCEVLATIVQGGNGLLDIVGTQYIDEFDLTVLATTALCMTRRSS